MCDSKETPALQHLHDDVCPLDLHSQAGVRAGKLYAVDNNMIPFSAPAGVPSNT